MSLSQAGSWCRWSNSKTNEIENPLFWSIEQAMGCNRQGTLSQCYGRLISYLATSYLIWTPFMGWAPYITSPYILFEHLILVHIIPYLATSYLIWTPFISSPNILYLIWTPFILFGHLISYLYFYGFLVQATFVVWHFTSATQAGQTTICYLFVFVFVVFAFVFVLFVFLRVLGASNICWVTCHRDSSLLPRKS